MIKRTFAILATTMTLGFGGFYLALANSHETQSSEVFQISIGEVEKLLGKENVFIFDANSKRLYDSGHIPGAVQVAFDAVDEQVLPPNKDAKLIFYCMNKLCSASSHAASQAAKLGYRNVFHLPDGIQGWIKAGKSIEK